MQKSVALVLSVVAVIALSVGTSLADQDPRVGAAGTQTGNLATEELYKRVLPSIMTVVVDKPEGLSAGTAFLVMKDGLALTAWHLVKDGRRAVAKFSNGEEFEGVRACGQGRTP
jgi:S1-C subfamily serine protease